MHCLQFYQGGGKNSLFSTDESANYCQDTLMCVLFTSVGSDKGENEAMESCKYRVVGQLGSEWGIIEWKI